jgi:hypothetical protein
MFLTRREFPEILGTHGAGSMAQARIEGLRLSVVNATTGELLRELTIDSTRDYPPQA